MKTRIKSPNVEAVRSICVKNVARVLMFTLQGVRWRLAIRNVVVSIAATVAAFLLTMNVECQNTPGTATGRPLGSVSVSEIDSINYFSGRPNITIPITVLNGRGSASVPINISLDQNFWRQTIWTDSYENIHYEPIRGESAQYPSVWGETRGPLMKRVSTYWNAWDAEVCNPNPPKAQRTLTFLQFIDWNGTTYELRDTAHAGRINELTNCGGNGSYQNRGTVFTSSDGNGATFVSDTTIYDVTTVWDYPVNDWPTGYLYLRDGTVYRFEEGGIVWLRDRNGNKVTRDGLTFEDSAGHEVSTSLDDPIAPTVITTTYNGTGGATREIAQHIVSLEDALIDGDEIQTYDELFPSYALDPSIEFNPKVISRIVLPDDREFEFFYNSYGDIARIESPTGGAIEYTWFGGVVVGPDDGTHPSSFSGAISRRVTERRVYANGTDLTQKTTISRISSGSATDTDFTVDIRDGSNNLLRREKHYYYGNPLNERDDSLFYVPWKDGKEYKTETYSDDGSTLLRTVNQVWQQRDSVSWWPYSQDTAPQNDPRVVETTLELNDVSPKMVSKTTHIDPNNSSNIGYDQYSNPTDTWEYDYGSGSPGSFLRRTHTSYVTDSNYVNYSGAHIRNLPSSTWVSSDTAGNNKVALTDFEYDNYADNSTHSPLESRSSVTGHDTTNYGTGFAYRGNVTGVTSYANAATPSGAISTYAEYDILGNVIKTIDARGCVATLGYTDNFGTADSNVTPEGTPSPIPSQSTFAYPTSTTNCLNWTANIQYDYFTGKPVNALDINGVISKTTYNDPLDRPTQSVSAVGTAYEIQSSIDYDDENNRVESTSDLRTLGDNLIKSESFYDGLGRTTQSRSYKDGGYIKVETQYDALGRAKQTSNPYRPYLSETAVWTKSKYDALDRVIEVETPDGTKLYKSYSGPAVTVTDQAGRKRKGISDAFGRTTKVYEDPDSQNLETSYVFDVLGRLRKTIQGDQSRYFMYNDLGRLLFAKQPEQDTNSSLSATDPITSNTNWSVKYEYDNNGNITKTTDARGTYIEGTYDSLNRLTLRNYSDSTPDVNIYYDGTYYDASDTQQTATGSKKGKTTGVKSSVSKTNYTSFDLLGRLLTHQQITDGTAYSTSYSYSLSGALTEQTYPSGRVVKNVLDSNGDLETVKSKKNASFGFFDYAKNFTYNPSGAVATMQLGNGRWETATFNSRLQITQIGLGVTDNTQNLLKLEFDYEGANPGSTVGDRNNGSMREQKITVPTIGESDGFTAVQSYTYDGLNRLQSATEEIGESETWKQTFSYDRYGNRRFNTESNYTTTLPESFDPDIYNPTIATSNNRISNGQGYTYDETGSLTEDAKGQRFSYDAESRQKTFFNSANTGSTPDATYHYDGEGRRIRKLTSSETTVFVYNALGQLVAEYAIQIEVENAQVSYLTMDTLGSPRVITDENGKVSSRRDFMPFGEEIAAEIGDRNADHGYVEDAVRQKFTGYEQDEESGLEFAQARYFNSGHGRFTSVDPLTASATIRDPQTLNRYTYALNSPYKFTDPLGLWACAVPGGGNTPCLRLQNLGNETEKALAEHNQRLQDTYDTLAEPTESEAGAVSEPIVNLTGLQVVDAVPTIDKKSDAENTDLMATLSEGNLAGNEGNPLAQTGPEVNTIGTESRLREGAKAFLRLEFEISGDSRATFVAPVLQSKNPVTYQLPGSTKSEVPSNENRTSGGRKLSVYIPLAAVNMKTITVKVGMFWTNKIDITNPRGIGLDVPHSRTTTFRIRLFKKSRE